VGDLRLAEGESESALTSYREAERIDDTMAELQFRIGKLHQAQSRSDLARERLTLARDLDALRFRADSEINEAIRAIAADARDAGVLLADTERRFQAVSPQGLPGHSLFLEHVHPTFSGNYLIALTWLEQAGAGFPEWQTEASGSILDEDELARRLAYSPFDRKRLWSTVARRLSRPPFTDQLDHDEQLRRVRERIERFAPTQWGEVLEIYEDALAARPDDPWLRYNLATVLGQIGEHDRAAAELHAFLELFPRDPSGRERLCQTEVERLEFDNALAECGRLIQLLPYHAPPRYTTAYSLASLGRLDDAIAVYRQLLTIDPGSTPQILNEIGRIEMHRSRFEVAVAVYREALDAAEHSANPLIPDVRFNYASALRAAGQADQAVQAYADAAEDYRRVIELDPASVAPRLALARCLSEVGHHDEAERVRREAHRLETQLAE
jgi:tetratricopeptide (TPR) repeat protein